MDCVYEQSSPICVAVVPVFPSWWVFSNHFPSGDHFHITNVSSYNVLQLCHLSTKDPHIVGPSLMINTWKWGFPGGSVVNDPPVNAGATCSIPGPEDPTCHGASELVHRSYWARAPEPAGRSCWNLWAESPYSAMREAMAGRRPHWDWGAAPLAATGEKPVQQLRLGTANMKIIIIHEL